jgi:exopolysaccharide biosynthesis polyprenyl glycosylphosphotransferase
VTRVVPWSESDISDRTFESTLIAVPDRAAAPLDHAADRLARSAEPVAQWSRAFVRQLLLTDAAAATVAIAIGWLIRFGFATDALTKAYVFWSVFITAAWLLSLHATGAYEIRRISTGAREYQRVLRGSSQLLGGVAVVGYLTGILLARTFVAIVIPLGAVLMVLARYAGRQTVHERRRRGHWTSAILAVGTSESVRHLAEVTSRNPEAGLVVVGACVEDAETGDEVADGVPVVGEVSQAAALAQKLGVDVVAVAGSGLGPRRIRELGWALEGTGCNMVMAPGLTEVAGPRVHVSPVEGLPLMWVDQPQFTGLRSVVKRGVDVVGALMLLLCGLPILIAASLAVRLFSRGPILFRQTRLGKDGQPFKVLKFRTMVVDAEQKRDEMEHLNETAEGVHIYFKIRRDPRVTRVGTFLRRYSIDELPQLVNVLKGQMSLVGPRPLPGDLDQHRDYLRRLRAKPGLTGLWQVSGRSDLSADDAVRLDLYYVENWSLALDLAIIARTMWAVLRGSGAY